MTRPIPHDRVGPCIIVPAIGAEAELVVPLLGGATVDCLRIRLRPAVLAALLADGAAALNAWTARQCLDNEARRARETDPPSVGAAPALSAPTP